MPILLLGLLIFFVGTLSTLYVLIQYSFLIALFGVVLSFTGIKAFRVILVPMIVLAFMIPLPNFIYNNLSSELQLISSQIGVAFIRLFDISVFLEGNVIDLGVYKLQVVEACNGLRYLFPLMTLGFIAAYFFTGAFWKRAVIFLSTIPITILMNSIRIGVIGVTVEYWGQEMADGFLHDFEGWVVFMSCIGILIVEMWILARIGQDKLPLREAFGLEFPEPTPEDAKVQYRSMSTPFYVSAFLMTAVALSVFALPERVEIEPDRKYFTEFPLKLDGWQGRKGYLEQIYIDALKFTDYAMNDYVGDDGSRVNFYSAYYASQRAGASAHSPKSCIPGGGWRITGFGQRQIDEVSIDSVPLSVNRLVIQKGDSRQLVYYWFQQRGRIITSEYLMKWYMFWDALTMNRTDGALMRLTTSIDKDTDIAMADQYFVSFLKQVSPLINDYVPGK